MEVQSSSSVIGKVSFQEELTSTLQNALGVAVEIAVVEITKLLDRALRDVQEKIQEAMQDNNALKSKLQTAETQLSTVRERLDQQPQGLEHFLAGGTKNLPISCRVQRGHRQFKPINVEYSSPKPETEFTVDPVRNYEGCGRKGTNVDFSQRESADDMTHGGAGVQTLNLNTQEEYTQHKLDETNDIKNDQHSISKNDPACAGIVTNVQSDGSFFEVAVKKEEGYDDSIPVSVVGGEEPNSDSLSLAQSRLLEDWRPQPLHSEDCQLNQPFQSTSQLPGQDFVLSSASGQHTNFAKLHRNSESNRYPPKQSRHHCSLCGRNFNRKQHLKIHQRIHTGERPYACSVCSARFRHALTLKRHFRIHTGEKPYACRQCGKTFRNGDGLRFHQCSITTTV